MTKYHTIQCGDGLRCYDNEPQFLSLYMKVQQYTFNKLGDKCRQNRYIRFYCASVLIVLEFDCIL